MEKLGNDWRDDRTSQDSWLLACETERHALHVFVFDGFNLFLVFLIGPQSFVFSVDKSRERGAIYIWVEDTHFGSLISESCSYIDCDCAFADSSFAAWHSNDFFYPQQIPLPIVLLFFCLGGQGNVYFFEPSSLQFCFKESFDSPVVFVEIERDADLLGGLVDVLSSHHTRVEEPCGFAINIDWQFFQNLGQFAGVGEVVAGRGEEGACEPLESSFSKHFNGLSQFQEGRLGQFPLFLVADHLDDGKVSVTQRSRVYDGFSIIAELESFYTSYLAPPWMWPWRWTSRLSSSSTLSKLLLPPKMGVSFPFLSSDVLDRAGPMWVR